jgi:phenylacetate-CoA ligase
VAFHLSFYRTFHRVISCYTLEVCPYMLLTRTPYQEPKSISGEELKSLQTDKLKAAIKYASDRSPFYSEKKQLRIDPNRSDLLEAFASVPFTSKEDLLNMDIYENLAVQKEEIVEVHCSSGTSNKPVYSFLTKNDLRQSSTHLARTWHMQGVRSESVFCMFASYGLFSAGMLNHYALHEIGALVIPAGNASNSKAFELLKEFGADSCAALASYYLYLVAAADMIGFDLSSLKLRNMIAGGEPFTEKQRAVIESKFGGNLYNQYGLCEINTGLAGECTEKNGLHILADYVYPEIIDPKTGAVLGDDQEGELVLTTFYKEASPLIRYRTGDITSISHAGCPCGRSMPRLSPIRRRTVETLFYKGVNIEKPYILSILEDHFELVDPYVWQMLINPNTASGKDELILKIKPSSGATSAEKLIESTMHKKLGFKLKVQPFTKDELAVFGNGKAKHFIDNRTL